MSILFIRSFSFFKLPIEQNKNDILFICDREFLSGAFFCKSLRKVVTMKGKCIGLRRFQSKSGKECRVATCAYDVSADKGFGVQTEEVFLPRDAVDPILNGVYIWSYNRSGYCDSFVKA